MRITNEWPSLVHTLMTERGLSERKLSSIASVHRSTLRRFFRGEAYHMPVEHLERLLAVFGYDLDAIQVAGKEKGA